MGKYGTVISSAPLPLDYFTDQRDKPRCDAPGVIREIDCPADLDTSPQR